MYYLGTTAVERTLMRACIHTFRWELMLVGSCLLRDHGNFIPDWAEAHATPVPGRMAPRYVLHQKTKG